MLMPGLFVSRCGIVCGGGEWTCGGVRESVFICVRLCVSVSVCIRVSVCVSVSMSVCIRARPIPLYSCRVLRVMTACLPPCTHAAELLVALVRLQPSLGTGGGRVRILPATRAKTRSEPSV